MNQRSSQLDGPPIDEQAIILFDGVCGLCHRVIQFVLRHDTEGRFRFCALDDPLSAEILGRHALNSASLDTVCLVVRASSSNEQVFLRSDAAVQVLLRLGGKWRVLGKLLRVVPRFLRDWGYGVVARFRYRVFGRYSACPVPTAGQRARFLVSS